MKKLIALAVAATLGLSLTVIGAQPASAACEDEDAQIARVQVDSDAAREVHPVFGQVFVEAWVTPEDDYPASVSAGANGPVMNCSDTEIEYIVEDPERFLGDVEAIVLFLIDQLLP